VTFSVPNAAVDKISTDVARRTFSLKPLVFHRFGTWHLSFTWILDCWTACSNTSNIRLETGDVECLSRAAFQLHILVQWRTK